MVGCTLSRVVVVVVVLRADEEEEEEYVLGRMEYAAVLGIMMLFAHRITTSSKAIVLPPKVIIRPLSRSMYGLIYRYIAIGSEERKKKKWKNADGRKPL